MKYVRRKRISDNLVTIHLARLLLNDGIDVDAEYKPRQKINGRGCRFDLVIIDGGDIAVIVETKGSESSTCTKQLVRYAKFGVPVILCDGLDRVQASYNMIHQILDGRRHK